MRPSSTFHGGAMGLILFAFRFFLLPMRYNNARWHVAQVEPLEVSTTVDNDIILRGLFQLVRGGGVLPYVLHTRGFFMKAS